MGIFNKSWRWYSTRINLVFWLNTRRSLVNTRLPLTQKFNNIIHQIIYTQSHIGTTLISIIDYTYNILYMYIIYSTYILHNANNSSWLALHSFLYRFTCWLLAIIVNAMTTSNIYCRCMCTFRPQQVLYSATAVDGGIVP